MKAVNNLLVDFFSNLTNPARCPMNNQEHEERLLFTKLRERLENIIGRIVAEIRGKFIPDEDDTSVLKIVTLDDIGNPIFEHLKGSKEAPAFISIDTGDNICRF